MEKTKFQLACERIEEHITKPAPGARPGLTSFMMNRNEREVVQKQVSEVKALSRSGVLERMEAIIRDGRLKFLKPKVTRTNLNDSFEQNGLYVTPQVQIVAGAELLTVQSRWHMDPTRPNTQQLHLPYVFHSNGISTGLSFSNEVVDDIIGHAVLDDVSGRLREMREALEQHWKTIESSAEAIESDYRGRRSGRDRKEFRKKMVKALRECTDLVDQDPEFILKVMQLDFHELETLSKFAKRNPADMPIIEVEDVKLALDELRVAGVMES